MFAPNCQMQNKKPLLEIVKEVQSLLIKEKLTAREILMILRELETEATLVLVLGQLALYETAKNAPRQGRA